MIDIVWLNDEQTIIGWTFSNDWTWDEFYMAQKQSDAMIDAVEGIVDGIFIPSKKPHMPDYAPMHFLHLLGNRHPRLDKMVIVAPRMFLTSLLDLVGQMMPKLPAHFHFVHDLAEAYTYIDAQQSERHKFVIAN